MGNKSSKVGSKKKLKDANTAADEVMAFEQPLSEKETSEVEAIQPKKRNIVAIIEGGNANVAAQDNTSSSRDHNKTKKDPISRSLNQVEEQQTQYRQPLKKDSWILNTTDISPAGEDDLQVSEIEEIE